MQIHYKIAYSFLNVVSFVIILMFTSCKELPVMVTNIDMLKCQMSDVSCTEIRLTLNTATFPLPAKAIISVDGGSPRKYTITTRETTITVDSLLPGRNYSIQGMIDGNNKMQPLANLNIRTLDTTSHNWSLETTTIGINSSINDVVIVNDTLAYVVGSIFPDNAAGDDLNTPYCSARWNGKTWTLRRLYFLSQDYHGWYTTEIINYVSSVFSQDTNNIWFASGSLFHWNGKDSVADFIIDRLNLPNMKGSVIKLFGFSNDDIYGVGDAGTIVHYSVGKWQVIPSGTDLDFYDIYGTKEPLSGAEEIYAVCSRNLPFGTGIFSVNGNTSKEIPHDPLAAELSSVWFVPNQHYYVGGDGIYEKTKISDSLWRNNGFEHTRKSTTSIRGNGVNDVFIVGAFGELLHFNGVTWKSYINETSLSNGCYGSIAVKGNLFIAVGFNNYQGIITIGRR